MRLIRPGDTVATGGFVGIGFAEEIAIALEALYLKRDPGSCTDRPSGLTLLYAAGQGDGKQRGLNHLAHPGLVKRAIGGHWGLVPKLQQLAVTNLIEAYNLPQGVIAHLFRDIAAGKPGHLSRIGLGTFVDPRHGGGKLNARTHRRPGDADDDRRQGVPVLQGRSRSTSRIVRGTTADPDGNITMEREALTLESAVDRDGRAQQRRPGDRAGRAHRRARHAQLAPGARSPGILVDCVVVAEAENHPQTFGTAYSAAYAGEIRVPADRFEPIDSWLRKVIARRAALELRPNSVVNLGIGMPEGVAAVAAEEKHRRPASR